VTFKADGKSSNAEEPISEEFTQRGKNEDFSYEKHDTTETKDYRDNIKSNKFLFWFTLCLVLGYLLLTANEDNEEMRNEALRDKILAKQQVQREKSEGPFHDA
jgi:hypothetical protein